MVSSGASEDRNLTPSTPLAQSTVTTLTPAAESGSQAIVFASNVNMHDARWIFGSALLYLVLVVVTVLTLHPYFSQTWDVATFINAGQNALSPEWRALYANSTANHYWPYAYPPLHAYLVAPFITFAGGVPDWLMVRVPPLLFDIALGVLLYVIVWDKTQNKSSARLAMMVWLLNPVTWYDTAVQGHFEAEWLFFVVLAYLCADIQRAERQRIEQQGAQKRLAEQQHADTPQENTRYRWVLPTILLAIAFLLKQNAILFALPLWAQMFFGSENKNWTRRALPVLASMVVFVLPVLVISMPFLLYSNDYWYMNVQYVGDVPLQTQSWLVALAGLFGSDNVILNSSSIVVFLAAVLISMLAARRKISLWVAASLIVLAFFLVSKKVVGYYYVMILPFALVALVPTRHFKLLSVILVGISFVAVSPYFASWANQAHWWLYGALGILNSVLWLGIFIWFWRKHPLPVAPSQNARLPAFLALGLVFSAAVAALLQPLINSPVSPIRAPLIPGGLEGQTLALFLGFLVLVSVGMLAAGLFTRSIARTAQIPAAAYALVLILAPLYFLTFTLTKESTAALEVLLKTIGL